MDPDVARVVRHPSFRSFADHLPCVLYVGRPDWPPAIEFITDNVERFVGYRPEEFYADPELSLRCMHPDDRARVSAHIRQAMERPEPYRVEYRALHRNGKDVSYVAMLSVPVLDAEGRVLHRQGIIMDITEQKRLESELLQTQRLAAIGELAAMMAHEIRNPLAGMSLALRALRGLVGGDPEATECLDDLDSCLVRINDTVSRALDFAKVRPLALRPCHLAEIVASAWRLTATYVRRRGVRVECHVPSDLPALVADASQIEQVFVNLILNACKAMPEGGRLTLRAWDEPGRLVTEVSDTGVGIAKEECERIFSPFYSGFGEGSGLGLPLCQRILSAHGGGIRAESTPGKGTTFRLEVPLEPSHGPRAAH